MMNIYTERCLVKLRPRAPEGRRAVAEADSRPVLICFPHAGGTAAFFRAWRGELHDVADVVAVELPGRGARRDLPLPQSFDQAVSSVWAAVWAHSHRPCGLYGHSLGALIAFEIARHLTAYGRGPRLLVVSGRDGPSTPGSGRLHRLPDAELIARLAGYGGIPAQILGDRALVRLLLPALRADLRLAERYQRAPGPVLRCPIVGLYGAADPLTTHAGVTGWQAETSARGETVKLAGGHFCVQAPGYPATLRRVLAAPLARAPAAAGRAQPPGTPRPQSVSCDPTSPVR